MQVHVLIQLHSIREASLVIHIRWCKQAVYIALLCCLMLIMVRNAHIMESCEELMHAAIWCNGFPPRSRQYNFALHCLRSTARSKYGAAWRAGVGCNCTHSCFKHPAPPLASEYKHCFGVALYCKTACCYYSNVFAVAYGVQMSEISLLVACSAMLCLGQFSTEQLLN
jgi:hypothetical protein